MKKGESFNKWCQKNWISTCKKKKKVIYFYPYFTPYTKPNSKSFTDLDIKSEIKKLPGENLCHYALGKDFLDTTLIDILNFIKMKGSAL